MKNINEASIQKINALSDTELVMVLLKYYSDIVLPFAYDSKFQPNQRKYSNK